MEPGSEIFGTKIMNAKDIMIFIKANKKDSTAKELTADIKLIDDLLMLQKSKSLLNKKRNLKQQIDHRLNIEVGVFKAPSEK
jgi:hypothetical protein